MVLYKALWGCRFRPRSGWKHVKGLSFRSHAVLSFHFFSEDLYCHAWELVLSQIQSEEACCLRKSRTSKHHTKESVGSIWCVDFLFTCITSDPAPILSMDTGYACLLLVLSQIYSNIPKNTQSPKGVFGDVTPPQKITEKKSLEKGIKQTQCAKPNLKVPYYTKLIYFSESVC